MKIQVELTPAEALLIKKALRENAFVNDKDAKLASGRLALAQCVSQVLKNAMNVVLIPYLETM